MMKDEGPSNIVSLDERRVKSDPHIVGPVKCMACSHEWTGMSPVGCVQELECPECHCDKGVFMKFVAPGPEVVHCEICGAVHFILSPDKIMCSACGSSKDISLCFEYL